MKKIYLSVFASLAFLVTMASPDIYTPTLVAPNNNAVGSAPNVELNWDAVAGQVGLFYEIQLSTDEAFTNPQLFTTDLTAIRMSELLFGNSYYWRVRAKDSQATSDWSDARMFTVIVKPNLTSPTNDAQDVNPDVTIKWGVLTGVTFFDYQIDLTPDFNSPQAYIVTVAGTENLAVTSSLYFGQRHYWRVRARHAIDTSEWSLSRNFTVLSQIKDMTPTTGASGISPVAEFTWKKITGLTKYNLFIDDENQFDQSQIFTVAPALEKIKPDTLLFGTQYFWKLEAIHSKDTLVSSTLSFTTIDKVTLTEPANNSTNISLTPFLKWTKIDGVLLYKLEFASNPEMNNALLYSITATTTAGDEVLKMPSNLLDSANTYYWRVQAITSRDTSHWSDTWKFRCAAVGIDAPVYRNGMVIYPSPANDIISVQLKSGLNGKATVKLFDLLGKARIEREVTIANGIIRDFQLGNLSNGVYMLKVETPGSAYTSKLIIKR